MYHVRLAPRPIVVDCDSQAVPDARIIEIPFPGVAVVTIHGSVNIIIGPGMAEILVGDMKIRNVPLWR